MAMMKRGLAGLLVLAGLLIGLLAGQLMVSGTVHAEDQVPREVMEQLLNRIENWRYPDPSSLIDARIDGDTVLVRLKANNLDPRWAVYVVSDVVCREWKENLSQYKTIVFTAILVGSDGVASDKVNINWTICTLDKKLDKYWNLVDEEKQDDAEKLFFSKDFQDKSLLNRLGKEQLTFLVAMFSSLQSINILYASYRFFDVEVIDQKLHFYIGWVAPGPYDDEPFKANGDFHPYVAQEIRKHLAESYCDDKAVYWPVIDFGVEFVFHFYADGRKTSFAVDKETCADLRAASDFEPAPTYSSVAEKFIENHQWESAKKITDTPLNGDDSLITPEMLQRGLAVAKKTILVSDSRLLNIGARIDDKRIILNVLGPDKQNRIAPLEAESGLCDNWWTSGSKDKFLSYVMKFYSANGTLQSRRLVNWSSCNVWKKFTALRETMGEGLEETLARLDPEPDEEEVKKLGLEKILAAAANMELNAAILSPTYSIRTADVEIVDNVVHVYQGPNLAVTLAHGREQDFEPYSDDDAEWWASRGIYKKCSARGMRTLIKHGLAYRIHLYQEGHQVTYDVNKDTCREYWDS